MIPRRIHLVKLFMRHYTRHGNVEILKRFWLPVEPWQYEDIVHPILVYADLLATGDERNIETARMVYERHIIRLVREN